MRTSLTLGLLALLAVPPSEAARPRRKAAGAHARGAAAPSSAGAQVILDDIARRGPRPVLDELYAREARWRPVIEGVATGQPKWLEVAARFKPVALRNLSVSQELTVAVSRALEREPAQVLAVLEGAFDTDDVCSLNTVEDSLGEEYDLALRTVERRERAVARVTAPALAKRRDDCLEFLRELKGEVVRNRQAWFPSR
jgi:hypothetical protein